MTFLAPWALLGIVAAAVPLILHLVRRQPPPEQAFPAMRYLSEATREHRRRLRLEDLLLLIARTVLVAALVLAAAGPILPFAVPFGRHAPAAMVVILDDSPSSGVMIDGEPLISRLRETAWRVLRQATPADRLWLIPADGLPRAGTADQLIGLSRELEPSPGRFDLGRAVALADRLIAVSGRRGQIVVVSDAQRTAVSAADVSAPVLVLRPEEEPPLNRSFSMLDPGPQPWGREGGSLLIGVEAGDSATVPVAITVDGRESRELLVAPGMPAARRIPSPPPGWHLVRVELPPDELRWDDAREFPLRVSTGVAADWDPADRYVGAAMDVLLSEGRIVRGAGSGAVTVGALGSGPSLVVPPADPALLGALNRELAARGSAWRFTTQLGGEVAVDSGGLVPAGVAAYRRTGLELQGAAGDTLATAGGLPWLVRSGDLVLIGSRLDPAWTDLPTRAAFLPLLDALVTRVVSGEEIVPVVAAGEAMALPSRADSVISPTGTTRVEGGSRWTPRETGVHWLLAGGDTIAGVAVIADPRESALERAGDAEIAAAWKGAVVREPERGAGDAFALAGRGDLRPLLLALAALCLVVEASVLALRTRR